MGTGTGCNATVKVYPVLVGSSTAVNSDGTIPVTATTNTHNRYAIYFGNNDCAKVRVEVISEGGYAKASYFVTIKTESRKYTGYFECCRRKQKMKQPEVSPLLRTSMEHSIIKQYRMEKLHQNLLIRQEREAALRLASQP